MAREDGWVPEVLKGLTPAPWPGLATLVCRLSSGTRTHHQLHGRDLDGADPFRSAFYQFFQRHLRSIKEGSPDL